jgi:cell division protease FtsH
VLSKAPVAEVKVMKISKQVKWILASALFVAGLILFIVFNLQSPSDEITPRQLTFFIQKKLITKATVTPTPYAGIYTIEGHAIAKGNAGHEFTISTVLENQALEKLLALNGVKLEGMGHTAVRGQWLNILPALLIAGVVGGMVWYQTRLGKNKSAHKIKARPTVRFEDIAGIEEAKGEVTEIVDFLRNPKKYGQLGGKLPKGVLLVGPPGTGKTMLAKAIAGEADANFFSAHGSDFNEIYVGVGAKRVRELFRQAARNQPAIIFIDEIDCLGKNRKFDNHGELQQTNNALLAAMDGFESNESVVVIAATNRPEDLDEALLRPGRFDRKVHVPYPDRKGRRAILETHSRNKPIHEPARALEVIAQTTPGMSGADLANLVNEAAILCAQLNREEISLTELEAARDKVRFGLERKSMILNQKEREMVAYHEAGHALINLQKKLLPPLYQVSIIPRGQALGVTTLLPTEDQNLQSRNFLLEELAVLMGGRAAEKIFFGNTSSGAAGDLDVARKIAFKMVHEWGMGEKLYYQPEQRDAEQEINRLLEAADQEALALVQKQKKNMQVLAEALLARETLSRQDILNLFKTRALAEGDLDWEANAFPV